MQCNVGGVDRWVRIVLGLAILGLGAYYGSWWGIIGILILATGIFRFCALYTLCGVSTYKCEEPAKNITVESAAPTATTPEQSSAPAAENQSEHTD